MQLNISSSVTPNSVILRRSHWIALVSVATFIGAAIPGTSIHAATKTWTGSTDGNWNVGANWGGSAPTSGDSLIFSGGSGYNPLTDNLMRPSAYNVAGITFSAGAGSYDITPFAVTNGFTLTGDIVNNSSNTQYISDLITITGTKTFTTNANGGNLNVSGVVNASTGGIIKSGGGTLILGGDTYTTTTTINGGTVQIGAGGPGGTITGAITNNANLAFNCTNPLTISSAISGTGTVNQIGTGTVMLTGTNTYSGVTTISSGTLQIGNYGTTGTLGSGAVINNAALSFTRKDNTTVANAISGTGTVKQLGSGVTILTGNNTYTGATVINGGTLQVGNGGTTGTLGSGAVNMANYSKLAFNRSDTITVANTIGGIGITVYQNGTGTLFLTGANTYSSITNYSSVTYLNSGTLKLGNQNALQYSELSLSGGTLVFDSSVAGKAFNTGGLSGSGNIVLENNAATPAAVALSVANIYNSTTYYGGILSGAGSLNKTDQGTLWLSGANTYTGGTSVSNGTLVIGAGGELGTGAVNISSTGTLSFRDSNAHTIADTISGTGVVSQNGTGALTLTAANTCATNLSSGTVFINGNSGWVSITPSASTTVLAGAGTIGGSTLFINQQAGKYAELRPGATANSIGTLTFSSSLDLTNATSTIMDISGASADQIVTKGALTYGGALTINFNSSLTNGSTIDLFAIKGVQSGNFTAVSFIGTYIASMTNTAGVWSTSVNGQSFTFTQSTGDLVVTSAVPEPSTYAALAGIIALGHAYYRRRRA